MVNVEFEDQGIPIAERNKALADERQKGHGGSIATDFLMKLKLVHNEKQANYTLLGVSILFLFITATFIIYNTQPEYRGEATGIENIDPKTLKQLPPELLGKLRSNQ